VGVGTFRLRSRIWSVSTQVHAINPKSRKRVPFRVIQALLGHASPDSVMIYAKLYPSQLIEEYRKTVRSLYNAFYGEEDGLKNPTAEEWAAFAASCNLRDMGTHLCALPTGEHCPKGLICLGCTHAQPKKTAAPIVRSYAGQPRAQPDCCPRSLRRHKLCTPDSRRRRYSGMVLLI
jgi:hypothetical protein